MDKHTGKQNYKCDINVHLQAVDLVATKRSKTIKIIIFITSYPKYKHAKSVGSCINQQIINRHKMKPGVFLLNKSVKLFKEHWVHFIINSRHRRTLFLITKTQSCTSFLCFLLRRLDETFERLLKVPLQDDFDYKAVNRGARARFPPKLSLINILNFWTVLL